ncbi:MAG TPA: ATP-binding protein [Steroidobacter sp.]
MTVTTSGKTARDDADSAAAPASAGEMSGADARTARLLEQLMQIARISALEEMASGIAHELNQPIGAITTFAQAAERMLNRPEPLVAQAIEVLQHISAEAIGAGAGIRRIRALFDGREGERTTCELAEVVSELRPVLELLASRAGMELEIVVEPGLPQVSVDRLRIQHVLFTLVQNALELPHKEGTWPRVRIELSGDRYSVLTKVIDSGPGISVEASEQLFRPFFTTKERGTGLGLASSRAIIEAHEGTIGFENRMDGGAEFWFRLPAAAGGSIA